MSLVRDTSPSPLAACMRLLTEHMHTASNDQLTALYKACACLLKAEEGMPERLGAVEVTPLLGEILDHINRNLCDPALTPTAVARTFGISVRYLHKLFAPSGMTFGAYVVMRRVDRVRDALVSGSAPTRKIAELARSWGFRDISAFNRAFRKRFGCAPRQLRARCLLNPIPTVRDKCARAEDASHAACAHASAASANRNTSARNI